MAQKGMRGANGQLAATPFTNGPYDMDQVVNYTTDVLKANGNIVSAETIINFAIPNSNTASTLFIANDAWEVTKVEEAHVGVLTAGTATVVICNADAVTPANGTAVISDFFEFTSAVDTVVTGTLSTTAAIVQLADGDRLVFRPGALTGAAFGGVLTIHLKRI